MKQLINKKLAFKIFILTFLVLPINISCKTDKKSEDIFVASWNLENLFDTVDDTNKYDEEFTPTGSAQWTEERLELKLENLSHVISSMNNGNGPDILGVCEVEHESLLQKLVSKIKLNKNYNIAYAESPDERGIDNGLIFNADIFSLIRISPHKINDNTFKTRFILQVDLLLIETKDTLSFFINHWPSRRTGESETENKRKEAAQTLRNSVDTEFNNSSNNKIIILGDFNDEPTDNSILNVLNAQPIICDSPESSVNQSNEELFNLAYNDYKNGIGTYKYHDHWNMLDQIIISNNLLVDGSIKYICGTFKVFKPEFMVEQSGKYKGTAFPTYGGRKYLGGFSDHFPVIARFRIKADQ